MDKIKQVQVRLLEMGFKPELVLSERVEEYIINELKTSEFTKKMSSLSHKERKEQIGKAKARKDTLIKVGIGAGIGAGALLLKRMKAVKECKRNCAVQYEDPNKEKDCIARCKKHISYLFNV